MSWNGAELRISYSEMTKGQRAMAVAKLYPESQQGRKGTSLKIKEVNQGSVSQARTVLKHLPEMAELVLGSSWEQAKTANGLVKVNVVAFVKNEL